MPNKFRDKRTLLFASGEFVKDFQECERQAYRRLEILEAATSIQDLRNYPSNRFEALSGKRDGQYSIRINKKWRICFEWPAGSTQAWNIEITDYH